jgi:hypothetical protein
MPAVRRSIASAALSTCAAALLGSPAAALQAPAQERVAARAGETTLSFAELDQLVLERHALGETGRAALKHLVRARLLDQLARESRLEVGPAAVDARCAEFEAEIGAASGRTLDEYLAENGVSRAKFREFLRLAIVQETLARRALGLPEKKPVPGDQQEMWLDQVIAQRGTSTPPPPWPDGVAARCGGLEIGAGDYLAHLRDQLDPDTLREDCYQALLKKRVLARMSDVSDEGRALAVEAELARRRAEAAAEPKYRGLTYDQVLAAQGSLLAALPHDPAIVSAALAHVWVDRTHGEDGLKQAYASERAWFDGRFGDAYELRVLFLRAAHLTNALVPRSFGDAERDLDALRPALRTAAEFAREAKARSEDARTRENGGLLGFVTAGDESVPEPIRSAAFGAPGTGERAIGPVRLQNGVALVWIGAKRPASGWNDMRRHVHRELRRRFLEDVLPKKDVTTYLDES